MSRTWKAIAFGTLLTVGAGPALALPEIISLGTGSPNSVTASIGGIYTVGGAGAGASTASRWTLNGAALSTSSIAGSAFGAGHISADGAYSVVLIPNTGPTLFGNTATGVAPPFSTTPTLVPSTNAPAATEFRAARWNASTNTLQDLGGLPIVPSLMVYGSGSSGSSSGNFVSPNAISSDGRFIVGLGYVSSYNSSAGTTISASTFHWRAWIWDAQANAGAGGMTVLPTPFRTSTNSWRRRTANAYDVSTDGTVIVGAQEHGTATLPTADPDGGRLVVWRYNPGTSEYEMSYLPNGVDGSGFPYTLSSTPGSVHMNDAGTLIVGMAVDNSGAAYLAKWIWDAGSSTWNNPINLGSNLAIPATWLPESVTSCGLPPIISPLGMSEDGNTIVGSARYSTCGSFMTGGFIWTAASGVMSDWYDYCAEQGIAGIATDYSPIDVNGFPTPIGLPRLGSPVRISADGNAIVGQVLGPALIPGAPPWLMINSGGPGCVAPVVTSNPTTPTNYSACTSQIILNTSAGGTLPVTYQWYKDGAPLSNGLTAGGSTITGATSFQLRVSPPLSVSDTGLYHAEATGGCGSPAIGATATVQIDPAFATPAANDTCLTAQSVIAGSNVLAPAQSPCSAFEMDPLSGASCVLGSKADRWFVFVPDATGDYRLETCGSNYDTVLSIFDGCGGNELACNNDYETGPSAGCTNTRSRITSINLMGGVPYYIRIAAPTTAFLSGTSTMNLSIIGAPTPAANDSCSTPTPALLGANALDTTEATNDAIATCNNVASRDVWFSYMPMNAGRLRLATCPGTTWNTVLGLYESCFGLELACNDNAGVSGCSNQSIVSYGVVLPTNDYRIRVGGNTLTAFGVGQLHVSLDRVGDVNCDGNIDFFDIDPFLLALFDATAYAATYPTCYLLSADLDLSNGVDFFDIDPFLDCLFNAVCP